jgi:hypothetical protein
MEAKAVTDVDSISESKLTAQEASSIVMNATSKANVAIDDVVVVVKPYVKAEVESATPPMFAEATLSADAPQLGSRFRQVLCIGDSLTSGLHYISSTSGDHHHHPYGKQLEKMIGSKDCKVVVKGYDGYGVTKILGQVYSHSSEFQNKFDGAIILAGTSDLLRCALKRSVMDGKAIKKYSKAIFDSIVHLCGLIRMLNPLSKDNRTTMIQASKIPITVMTIPQIGLEIKRPDVWKIRQSVNTQLRQWVKSEHLHNAIITIFDLSALFPLVGQSVKFVQSNWEHDLVHLTPDAYDKLAWHLKMHPSSWL